jgi:CubicO group peptidase (beta-lactamase class C family)
MSLGLYMQELIRRVDPARRSLGRFFEDEIAAPLGLDFHIGLPREVPDGRLATVKTLSLGRALFGLHRTPTSLIRKLLEPRSLLRRSFLFTDLDWNDRRTLEIELPVGNGVGTARALARAYACLAEGGAELGITPQVFAQLTAPPELADPIDVVLGVPTCFSLGFMRPGAAFALGSSPRALGAPGAGGSFAFADPDAHLGYAYVTNKLDVSLSDDPREKPVRDAVYLGIARLHARELIAR